MREFFVLLHDSDRDDLEAVTDYEMDAFDLTTFWNGQRFEGSIPASVRLWVGEGQSSDYLGNPLSWDIVSERLWSIIRPLAESDCQLVPLPLYYEKSKSAVRGYILMNVALCIPAVSTPADTGGISISNLVLDKKRVPADVHVFRLEESPTVVIASDAVLNEVWGKHLQGIAFLRTHAE